MKIVFVLEDYRQMFTTAVEALPDLKDLVYDQVAARVYAKGPFYGDSYIHHLTELGHEVEQLIPDCRPLQEKWISARAPFGFSGLTRWLTAFDRVRRDLLLRQLAQIRPDAVLVHSYSIPRSGIPPRPEFAQMRALTGKLVLWWSCPLDAGWPYEEFDLILSCIPGIVRTLRSRGLNARHLRHAFDARYLDGPPEAGPRRSRICFVGSMDPVGHAERWQFLNALADKLPLRVNGADVAHGLSPETSSEPAQIYGEDLHREYGRHLLAVHRNIGVAGSELSAKRVFEAIGMGACLLVEDDPTVGHAFDPGTEIVTYRGLADCIETCRRLLEDEDRARAIGSRGQARVLRDHTYRERCQELVHLLSEA